MVMESEARIIKEPDAGKPQVRFCEGRGSSRKDEHPSTRQDRHYVFSAVGEEHPASSRDIMSPAVVSACFTLSTSFIKM